MTHIKPTQSTKSIRRPMPAKGTIGVAAIIGALAILFAASYNARSLAHGAMRGMTLADIVFFIAGIILFAGSGPIVWRGRQAGAALLTLRRSPHTWLYGTLAIAFVAIDAIDAIRFLTPHPRQPSVLFLNLAWVVFCLARIANRPRVSAQGIVDGARFLPWQCIVSYEVSAARHDGSDPSGATLTIQYYASLDPSTEVRSRTIRCAAARRRDIEILLARYVRTEQGHRRWHARRVQTAQAVQPSGPMSAVPALRAVDHDTMIAR